MTGFLRDALTAQGLAFARVNPARARDFARATGQLAKTDAIDARMLAAMAQTLSPDAFVPVSAERRKLADLQLRRDQLVTMRAEERTRLEAMDDKIIVKAINRHLAHLSKEIETFEAMIADLQSADAEIADAAKLLRSIPGIGPVTTTVLITLMPELGHCTPGEVAALAGLAPFNIDSGTVRGKRRIRGGRSRVRNALYMTAIVASRGTNKFANFYRAHSKPVESQPKSPSSQLRAKYCSRQMPSSGTGNHSLHKNANTVARFGC